MGRFNNQLNTTSTLPSSEIEECRGEIHTVQAIPQWSFPYLTILYRPLGLLSAPQISISSRQYAQALAGSKQSETSFIQESLTIPLGPSISLQLQCIEHPVYRTYASINFGATGTTPPSLPLVQRCNPCADLYAWMHHYCNTSSSFPCENSQKSMAPRWLLTSNPLSSLTSLSHPIHNIVPSLLRFLDPIATRKFTPRSWRRQGGWEISFAGPLPGVPSLSPSSSGEEQILITT